MTKIIIVRHCQAEGNLKRFFQGSIDTDITELGEKQIRSVAKLLADKPIEVMYSSPKKRAMKTAEGINAYHQLPIRIDEEIVEIDAAKGPIMAKPTKAGGITVTMVFGMILSTPP